jgi:hypothetical protein
VVTAITQSNSTEILLLRFEEAINEQAKLVGVETAHAQAKKAGLGVSYDGKIVSCAGDPTLVLLRLIKHFTEGGNILALSKCTPLINEMIARLGVPESTKAETE